MESMFSVAFTDINTVNLELSRSNFVDNKLVNVDGNNPYPGLVHVRYTTGNTNIPTVEISEFYFAKTNFGDNTNSKVISRGRIDHSSSSNIQQIIVKLNNCYFDFSGSERIFYEGNLNPPENFNIVNDPHYESTITKEIGHLNLNGCQGHVKPPNNPQVVGTGTPSFTFTGSNEFSQSNLFSSHYFSGSDEFSSSGKFSESNPFSSHFFTRSDEFTYSRKFTNSIAFSDSLFFTPSNEVVERGPIDPGNSGKDEKNKTNAGMIAGIAVAAAAVVAAIIVAVIIFLKKRPHLDIDEDVETLDDSKSSVKTTNPLYNKASEDDPFKEDFANE